MRSLLLTAALLIPATAFAAGGGDDNPPKATKTTKECTGGKVFDEKTQKCVVMQDSKLDDDTLYQAAREFAYAGQYKHAQMALAAMEEENSDRILTYMGFTTRKMGDVAGGMAYYQAALTMNPDNILARSYMGQAHVEAGDIVLAKAQLSEIRTRGGRNTWAEYSLRTAIETGRGYSY